MIYVGERRRVQIKTLATPRHGGNVGGGGDDRAVSPRKMVGTMQNNNTSRPFFIIYIEPMR